MNQYQEQFRNFMEDKGFHVTKQRLSIAGLLSEMAGHPTIEELYDDLREIEPSIGQATVYRTLKLLKDAGLVMDLRVDEGVVRFEAVNTRKHHDHFICRHCGKIVEIHSPALEKAQMELATEHGFILEEQAHCVYGLCSECRTPKEMR
jgi:Fur family ferric uptake transcriptional regulator